MWENGFIQRTVHLNRRIGLYESYYYDYFSLGILPIEKDFRLGNTTVTAGFPVGS